MTKTTKERLLLAAVSEFAVSGYQATSVRNILKRAGEKNLSAITYHFGSKEALYKEVLDFMFRDAEKFKEEDGQPQIEALEVKVKLEGIIRFLCRAYYTIQNTLDGELYQLFVREAGNPTPYFEEMVERHLKPTREYLCTLLREYLGPEVPQQVIDDCEYSISGQILYGILGQSIICKTHPERVPFDEYVEQLSDHVVKFSMAGLEAFRPEKK